MLNPEVIRRSWPGFGECRITVAPSEASAPGSVAANILAGLPRLFSRIGLGSLSFTVDPAWILQDSQPPAGPIVTQFLRVHRGALAEEWRSRQRPHVAQALAAIPKPIPVTLGHKPEPVPAQPTTRQAQKQSGDKGLPSWFGWYCAPGDPTRLRPKPPSREDHSASTPASRTGNQA
jgi:hypothetical protein